MPERFGPIPQDEPFPGLEDLQGHADAPEPPESLPDPMESLGDTLRRAATYMRRAHGPEHERHTMWAAIALLLQNEANAMEAEHVPYNGSRARLLQEVASAYLASSVPVVTSSLDPRASTPQKRKRPW